MPSTLRVLLLLLGSALPLLPVSPACAEGFEREDFSAWAAAVSDYVFRGYSQSDEGPALQAGIDLEHPTGLLAGLWASTIDFESASGLGDRGDVELYVYGGWGFEVGQQSSLALTLDHYEYPNDTSPFGYSYTEVALTWRRADTGLAAAWSDDALGSSEPGTVLEATHLHDLPSAFSLGLGLGFYDLEAPFLSDYLYWHAVLAREFGRVELSLGYYDTDDRGDELWPDTAGSRAVLGVSIRLL